MDGLGFDPRQQDFATVHSHSKNLSANWFLVLVGSWASYQRVYLQLFVWSQQQLGGSQLENSFDVISCHNFHKRKGWKGAVDTPDLHTRQGYSVTRWLDFFSIFGRLHQWKFAQWHSKFAKLVSKECQTLNKLAKNCPKY